MNWITNFVRPRIKDLMAGRAGTPENLWKKCPGCSEMLFHRDLEASLHVCPRCGHHLRIGAAQPFDFLGGSLGMGVGEALVLAMQAAAQEKLPFILFVASGGARMQEGILSLMQMPRVTIAVQMLREAAVPYIVVLTDPTTGGVSASYAMLGDIHIAEPGALIGF